MTREVRANVIFIVLLIIVATPGFCFLMYRKLHGSTRPNFMPDPVPSSIAYIQPLPAPPVQRKEPHEVRSWVAQLAQARPGEVGAMGLRNEASPPLVSDRFVTQFIGLTFAQGSGHVALLHWDDSANLAAGPKPIVNVDFVTGHADFSTGTVYPIDVPRDVRHALQDVGYVDPPQRVWWIEAVAANATNVGPAKAIRLTTEKVAGKPTTELIVFNAPATRPNIEASP